MGELTPLDHAISSVIGLAQCEHQRRIIARLRQRAAEIADAPIRPTGARALEMMANELAAELPESE